MIRLLTSKQIRELESEWILKCGQSESLRLMEKAGLSLADIIKKYNEPYLIVCGKGNNGGDGIVAARLLHKAGKKVFLTLTSDEVHLPKDAKASFNLIKNSIPWFTIESIDDNGFVNKLNSASTVIDCLLGTGVSGDLSELFKWIINSINNSGKPVIACDIPTGVNPDTGTVLETCVQAKETVTFGFAKVGLMLYPAKEYVGKLTIADIGLPGMNTNVFLLDDDYVKKNLPKRLVHSNKGTFGKTLLVCGSSKYPGAALLASKAAACIGSGLTALATTNEVFNQITYEIPEVTHVEFNINSILDESKKSSVLVIGPGLTTENEIIKLIEDLILNVNIPIVLDADGINVLAGKTKILTNAKSEITITPHPKEFSRLIGLSVEEVLNNRLEIVKQFAVELGCNIVLKGASTLIVESNGNTYISPFGNSALAKGGTGDVLSGFIGGLIAQGLSPAAASCVGVCLHGKAGEIISEEKTSYSLLPQDLITYLPKAIKKYI